MDAYSPFPTISYLCWVFLNTHVVLQCIGACVEAGHIAVVNELVGRGDLETLLDSDKVVCICDKIA